jgi:hypothetical protein
LFLVACRGATIPIISFYHRAYLGVLLTIECVKEQIFSVYRVIRSALLPILVVLFLTGCGQQSNGNLQPAGAPSSESTLNSNQSEAANLTLDCSSAITVSITVEEGRAYSPEQQISLLVDQPVRIVVQSDEVTTIDLRGSETYSVVEIEPGLSSVCTTYRQTGQYPVQVGNLIPLVFVVD